MSYTKTVWRNNQAPAINADNLNHIEQGIESAHNQMAINTSDIETLTTQVQNNASNIASEISTRQSTDSLLQSQIDQLVAPTGEAPSAAEVENARIGDDGVTYDTLGNAIRTQFSNVKSALYGKAETTSGGKLIDGYYPHDSGQVRSSANFNCYKYDISNADLVVVTLSGFNSTIAVASNSNYDAEAFPSASFSAQTDKLIYPSETYGSITRWTEIAYVADYDYLYVACYKNATPSVIGYNSQGALPIALSNKEAISSLNFIAERQMVAGYGTQLNTASSWEAFSNDADNLTPNRVYVVVYSTDIAHLPYSGFGGFIQTYSYNTASSTIILQTATRGNGKEIYQRVCWGGTWSAWQRISLYDDIGAYIESFNHTNDLWKTLHTVGVIGDSLASGESASNDGGSTVYHDLYPFSWGQCMARESGNTYYNFSKGGLTSKTWMTNADYGYALASQPDKLCDAYIIGLGVNDNIVGMTVGTSADINLSDPDANADTFYGNYGKIIQKMRILAPKAPIFVITQPTIINAYTAAIKAMATIFENVFVIDMYKYAIDFSDVNGLLARCQRSGHYNAIGYKIISKYISRELNNVMLDNFDDFMQIEFINTDWAWTE